jgi:hypothetical protein
MTIIGVGMMKTIVLFSTAPSYGNLSCSFPNSTSLCWRTFHLFLDLGLSRIPLLFLLDLSPFQSLAAHAEEEAGSKALTRHMVSPIANLANLIVTG